MYTCKFYHLFLPHDIFPFFSASKYFHVLPVLKYGGKVYKKKKKENERPDAK